jgi:transposase
MRIAYPSDVKREQFRIIEPILKSVKKNTNPTTVDIYDVFCAMLYVLKGGCAWRLLPHDFPKYNTVYYYFSQWNYKESETSKSVFDLVYKKLLKHYRIKVGKNEKTSFGIIDSQSVKNADTARIKGYDGNKKISGIKRNIVVDMLSLPHAIHITPANRNDGEAAKELFKKYSSDLSDIVNVLGDGGYNSTPLETVIEQTIGATLEITKRSNPHQFEVNIKRVRVEKAFGWINKCRRLWRNCERYLETSRTVLLLAYSSVILNRL